MSYELDQLKRDLGALRQAYTDAGGKFGSNDDHLPCPFCGDATGFSLHIYKDQAHWKCHSKCAGAGGSIVDLLMAARKIESKAAVKLVLEKYGTHGSANSSRPVATTQQEKPKKRYQSPDLAAEGLLFVLRRDARNFDVREYAPESGRRWSYTDERGEPVLQVLRFEMDRKHADGTKTHVKDIRPIHFDSNAWVIGLGPYKSGGKKTPLYNLRAIHAITKTKAETNS